MTGPEPGRARLPIRCAYTHLFPGLLLEFEADDGRADRLPAFAIRFSDGGVVGAELVERVDDAVMGGPGSAGPAELALAADAYRTRAGTAIPAVLWAVPSFTPARPGERGALRLGRRLARLSAAG